MPHLSQVRFVERLVNGRWPLIVPDYKTERWECHEIFRLESMAAHLSQDDVLYEIGAETGWMAALYARHFVRPENVFLFEPSDVQWPTIKAIWDVNLNMWPFLPEKIPQPGGTWLGFVAEKDFVPEKCHFQNSYQAGWPMVAYRSMLQQQSEFRGLRDRGDVDIPSTTLDTFILTHRPPTALSIDVEGAELLVLRGAENTLRVYHPKLWVSIHAHPADGFEGDYQPLDTHTVGPLWYDYKTTREQVLLYLEYVGYQNAAYLGYDHEEHWFFS